MNDSDPKGSSFYLVKYPDPPINIRKDKVIYIGRSEINDINISEARVSRRHAMVRWLDGIEACAIKDLQSLNGTYVNGSKLSSGIPHVLKNWDKIRIVTTFFTIREEKDPSLIQQEFVKIRQKESMESTQFMANKDPMGLGQQHAFSGQLSCLCPIELLQMIGLNGKTGRLKVATSKNKGEFVFEDGQVVKASFAAETGRDAVFEFFNYNDGAFTFQPEERISVPRETRMNTTQLVLEGCKNMDETNL